MLFERDTATSPSRQAFIAVTGNPATVFNRYVHQLTKLGIAFGRVSCNPDQFTARTVTGPAASAAVTCQINGTPASSKAPFSAVEMMLSSTGRAPDATWASSLYLSLTPRPVGSALTTVVPLFPEPVGVTTTTANTTVAPSGLPPTRSPPPPLPRPGELIPPKSLDPGVPLRVVAGSTVLVPAAPNTSVTGGWMTVLRITADPKKIVNTYLHQHALDRTQLREGTFDGRRLIQGNFDQAGGPKLYLTATPDASGTWYLFISVQND